MSSNNNPPTAHRKSSSLNRSWFEGTMEVISGMAPRPVTPLSQLQRPASAPNSPARGMVGIEKVTTAGAGGWLTRLPSQDSLDRSIHNESGHGKSTAQIIRDLKHSNSSLTAKMASQEMQYMNQLAEVERNSSKRQQELEESLRKMKTKMSRYEAYMNAAESKLQQQESALSKVKEESAFQRHTISDLKNQIYQLQTELEEAEEATQENSKQNHPSSHAKSGLIIAPTSSSMSTEDLQQIALDNEELVKEIQELQDQLMQYQGYDKKLKDMQRQLEDSQKHHHSASTTSRSSPTPMINERPPRAPSPSPREREHDHHDSSYYRQQLQLTQGELETQKQKLVQRESALTNEKETLTEQHSQQIAELKDQLRTIHQDWEQREGDIRMELSEHTASLESQLGEKNETIVELEEKLDQYAEKLSELAATLAESRQQAQNQEQYRRDEAEDLRMIQDAHEAEIARLEKEVDESRRELELRDEELDELKQQLQFSQTELATALAAASAASVGTNDDRHENPEDEKKSEEDVRKCDSASTSNLNESHDHGLVQNLEELLYNSTETVNKLELQVAELREERDVMAASFEIEREELLERLAVLEEQKRDKDTEFLNLKIHWEEKSNWAKEVESLKKEIESMRHRVNKSSEAGKAAEERIQEFENHVQDMEGKLNSGNKVDETVEGINELELARTGLTEAREEINRLNKKVGELELSQEKADEVEAHLIEAQEALIALDDQMQALQEINKELKSEAENRMESLLEETEARLRSKDAEMTTVVERMQSLETKKCAIERDLENLKTNVMVSASSPIEVDSIKARLEAEVCGLIEEKELLVTKLKDRDTTITTLVRSSVALEKMIESLGAEIEQSKMDYSQAQEELMGLRKRVDDQKEQMTKITEELNDTNDQLKAARVDANRWKRALQDEGTCGSDYRFQLTMLQKANDDYVETILERDQAIQNLVNQSIGQEAHVRDLKTRISSLMKEVELVRLQKGRPEDGALRAELQRLQEESEIFAGQIIEQDEEFKRMERALRTRDEQILSLKAELKAIVSNSTAIPNRGKSDVAAALSASCPKDDSEVFQRPCIDQSATIQNLQAELDEMREAAESNRVELRDLRRQLWEANKAIGSTNDLKLELEQARHKLEELTCKDEEADVSSQELASLRVQLEELSAQNEELARVFDEKHVLEEKLCDLDTILQERDTLVEELRGQLQFANEEIEESRGLLEENALLIERLRERIASLEDQMSAFLAQLQERRNIADEFETDSNSCASIDELNVSLWAKTESGEELSVELSKLLYVLRRNQDELNSKSKSLEVLQDRFEALQSQFEAMKAGVESEAKHEALRCLNMEIDNKTTLPLDLEAQVNEQRNENDLLRDELAAKAKTISQLESDLETRTKDFQETLELKMTISCELSDCQARLVALEKDVSEMVSTSSRNIACKMENQGVVDENVSLVQRNENLLQRNDEMNGMISRLTEEVETMNSDNKILCSELRALGQQCHSLSQANDSLNQEKESMSCDVTILKDELTALSVDKNALASQLDILKETAQEVLWLREKNGSLSAENAVLAEQVESFTKDLSAMTETNRSLSDQLDSLGLSVRALEERLASAMEEKHLSFKKINDLEQSLLTLQHEKSTAETEKEALSAQTNQLQEQNESISKQKHQLQGEFDLLTTKQDYLNHENDSLQKENTTLKTTIGELKAKNQKLHEKTAEMSRDLEALKEELQRVYQDAAVLDEYRDRLDQALKAREESEKSIIETYENQISALVSAKDTEIDELRKSLTDSRGKNSEDMERMRIELKALLGENEGIRDHFELELQAKDQQIFALEHTLHAQEQIVDSMRAEMDQLQSSMEHATKSRRDEVEEMQQEMMDVEARALKQEREIVALKMQLEESKLAHKAEVVKLKEALAVAADQNSSVKQTLSDLHENDRMLEVRERLEQLKARNTALQEENLKLGGRLERAAIQINASELEKERAEEIEDENKKLRQQLREYEELLTKSSKRASLPGQPQTKPGGNYKETISKSKEKRKKKFGGIFKRRNIDEVIAEENEGEEEEL